jgi:hypothetical protein
MKNANNAEPHSNETGGSESIEKIALGVLERFKGEALSLPRSFLLECFLDSFREWMGRPDMEAVTGVRTEIAVAYFDNHRTEFRDRFRPAIEAAYTTWEKASVANGSTVSH